MSSFGTFLQLKPDQDMSSEPETFIIENMDESKHEMDSKSPEEEKEPIIDGRFFKVFDVNLKRKSTNEYFIVQHGSSGILFFVSLFGETCFVSFYFSFNIWNSSKFCTIQIYPIRYA